MTGQVLPEKVRKGDPKRDRGKRTGFSTGATSFGRLRGAKIEKMFIGRTELLVPFQPKLVSV